MFPAGSSSGALLLRDLRLSPALPEPCEQPGHRAGAAAAVLTSSQRQAQALGSDEGARLLLRTSRVPSRARAWPRPTWPLQRPALRVALSVNHGDRRKKSTGPEHHPAEGTGQGLTYPSPDLPKAQRRRLNSALTNARIMSSHLLAVPWLPLTQVTGSGPAKIKLPLSLPLTGFQSFLESWPRKN